MRKTSLYCGVLALLICLVPPLFGVETKGHKPVVPLSGPGKYDSAIAQVTSQIMEKFHYLQHPLDNEMSSRFLDRYLSALDNQHLFFLESDRKEFEAYRTTLDDLTAKTGDLSPAFIVFRRFRERLEQQYDYVNQMLAAGKFEFTGNEQYEINRRKAAPPKDMADAKRIWRDRLRSEYLEQKLRDEKPEEIVKALKRRY
ncbi:MAG: hypothetical protein HYZ36_00910, partial [Pedosphaera parvula]|nr:hypothetical protein [Pedosphaera parvula]